MTNVNPTAGIGDPYWYEWSVGLLYILDMLDPDADIESVTLQSTDVQGLDDVVVKYPGRKNFIQIKHTRVHDTLTFGDLVASSGEEISLLQYMASAWKAAIEQGSDGEVTLFSNRAVGDRRSTVKDDKGGSYQRPALSEFWPHVCIEIKKAESLEEIKIPEEWSAAWLEWCEQLNILNDNNQRLQFLCSLSIQPDRPSLEELEKQVLTKIVSAFGISIVNAISIFSSLDHSLRIWTTTNRGKQEAITKEMVYEAISLPTKQMIGEHRLPPPEPFFSSRETFVKKLAAELLDGTYPVLFLTGLPGVGKTSIVNVLANRREPLIDLRFHAFRPITPDMTMLPMDAGITTTPVALWGDLLAQLRIIFKGRLGQFSVPIRNEFLTPEQLRDEVLRLATILASERKRRTIIAIDGIDHAARAHMDSRTFLETLIPPDAIPIGVCFLIAGQPTNAYDQYPIWLKSPDSTKVSVWEAQGIDQGDILELLKVKSLKIPVGQLEATSRLIHEISKGNTLAAIFAIHEAIECETVEILIEKLTNRQLASGISTYYETIWFSALSGITPVYPFIGYKLAGFISLSTQSLTPQVLQEVFKDISLAEVEWLNILRALRPLLVENEGQFVIIHNDIRVYLTRQLQGDKEKVKEVASLMSDYYWHSSTFLAQKHNNLFNLLRLSERLGDYARVFTSDYVLEACALGRPLIEIGQQCELALKDAAGLKDWDILHNVSCAVLTLKKVYESLSWTDRKIVFETEVPPVLVSEGSVPNPEYWTLQLVNNTLEDAIVLIRSGEPQRASGLMKRWFHGISPSKFISLFPEEVIFEFRGERRLLMEKVQSILEKWGRISQHLKPTNYGETERNVDADACFNGGFLKEALIIGGRFRWARSLTRLNPIPISDLEFCIKDLARKHNWFEVAFSLATLAEQANIFSSSFRVQTAVLALLTGRQDLIYPWVEPVTRVGFDYLIDFEKLYGEEHTFVMAAMCFVIGWTHPTREASGISDEAVRVYFSKGGDQRKRGHLAILFNACARAGNVLGACIRNGNEKAKLLITPKQLCDVVSALINVEQNYIVGGLGFNKVAPIILEMLIECVVRFENPFERQLFDLFAKHASSHPLDSSVEIVWHYLAERGEDELLIRWFEHYVGPLGIIWNQELEVRFDTVDMFSKLASKYGWNDIADRAIEQEKWSFVGYTGHKDYTLDTPLQWFDALSGLNPQCWENQGLRLLDLSNFASKTGDNRAEIYVKASVAKAASLSGIHDFWKLLSVEDLLHQEKTNMVFDGLIGALQTINISQQDILSLWCLAIGGLVWQDGYQRLYLEHFKKALLTTSHRLGFNVEPLLESLAPAEYSMSGNAERYRFPSRWFDVKGSKSTEDRLSSLISELSKVSISKAITDLSILLEKVTYEGDIWRAVEYCVIRLKDERPTEFHNNVMQLLSLVKKRSNPYQWTYDSVYIAYEALIPLLNDSERWHVVENTVGVLNFEEEPGIWITSAAENLNSICLYRAKCTGIDDLGKGINRVLDTQNMWVTGNGRLPELKKSKLFNIDKLSGAPQTWIELTTRILVNYLSTDSAYGTQAALRGLWALVHVDQDCLSFICTHWDGLSDKGKEWILLLAERVAISHPSAFTRIGEIVKQCYEGKNLRLKLQSWVVLKAYERVIGTTCPEFTYPPPDGDLLSSLFGSSASGLLKVPDLKDGLVRFSRGSSAVHLTMKQLEAATKCNSIEILSKLQRSLVRFPPPEESISNRTNQNTGDAIIVPSRQLDRLMDVIYHELFSGCLNDVPIIRLAQALTTSDDPFIFLNCPIPSTDAGSWPINIELESLVKKSSVLKEQLLSHMQNGIKEDEVLLDAILYTYSDSFDLKFTYNTKLKYPPLVFDPLPKGSTFNGRSFTLYHDDRFETPNKGSAINMTCESGGLADFIQQTV